MYEEFDNHPPSRVLLVGNIVTPNITEDLLRDQFGTCGPIESVQIDYNKACGFVTFVNLQNAIQGRQSFQGKYILGQKLLVVFVPDFTQPMPLPPSDSEEQTVIDKLALFVFRNPKFEEEIKQKEANNPKFKFLTQTNGPAYQYYQWKINQLRYPMSSLPVYAPRVIPKQPIKLSHEEITKQCQGILDNLSGSKESIKASKDWVLGHMENIEEVCEMFKQRAKELVEPIKKLHLVYLINDVLLVHTMKLKVEGKADPFIAAVKQVLPTILQELWWSKFLDDAEKTVQHEKVTKVLGLWKAKNIFDAQTIAHIEQEMKTEKIQLFNSKYTFEQLFEYLKVTPGHPEYEPINPVFLKPLVDYNKLSVSSQLDAAVYEFMKSLKSYSAAEELRKRRKERSRSRSRSRSRERERSRRTRSRSRSRSPKRSFRRNEPRYEPPRYEPSQRPVMSSNYAAPVFHSENQAPPERAGLGSAPSGSEDAFESFRLSRASGYRKRQEERILLGPEATAQKCFNCGKPGHFAKECPGIKPF